MKLRIRFRSLGLICFSILSFQVSFAFADLKTLQTEYSHLSRGYGFLSGFKIALDTLCDCTFEEASTRLKEVPKAKGFFSSKASVHPAPPEAVIELIHENQLSLLRTHYSDLVRRFSDLMPEVQSEEVRDYFALLLSILRSAVPEEGGAGRGDSYSAELDLKRECVIRAKVKATEIITDLQARLNQKLKEVELAGRAEEGLRRSFFPSHEVPDVDLHKRMESLQARLQSAEGQLETAQKTIAEFQRSSKSPVDLTSSAGTGLVPGSPGLPALKLVESIREEDFAFPRVISDQPAFLFYGSELFGGDGDSQWEKVTAQLQKELEASLSKVINETAGPRELLGVYRFIVTLSRRQPLVFCLGDDGFTADIEIQLESEKKTQTLRLSTGMTFRRKAWYRRTESLIGFNSDWDRYISENLDWFKSRR